MSETNPEAQVRGYSIWLIPETASRNILTGIINSLGDRSSTPHFPPHLTLLGQLEGDLEQILPKFKQLGGVQIPGILQVESVGMQDFYFRALFYKIRTTPDLISLNSVTRKLFGRQKDSPFYPHVSLLYSTASEVEKREMLTIVKLPEIVEIPIAAMTLVKTQGTVDTWETVARIEL